MSKLAISTISFCSCLYLYPAQVVKCVFPFSNTRVTSIVDGTYSSHCNPSTDTRSSLAGVAVVWQRINFCMRPANENCRYIVTSSLIGWAHTQNDPCSTRIVTRAITVRRHALLIVDPTKAFDNVRVFLTQRLYTDEQPHRVSLLQPSWHPSSEALVNNVDIHRKLINAITWWGESSFIGVKDVTTLKCTATERLQISNEM